MAGVRNRSDPYGNSPVILGGSRAEELAGILQLLANAPAAIGNRIEALSSDQRSQVDPGVFGALRTFANPEPVLAKKRFDELSTATTGAPTDANVGDALGGQSGETVASILARASNTPKAAIGAAQTAVANDDPQVAQARLVKLAATMAARGEDPSDVQTSLRGMLPWLASRSSSAPELLHTGLATGATTPSQAANTASMIDRRNAGLTTDTKRQALLDEKLTTERTRRPGLIAKDAAAASASNARTGYLTDIKPERIAKIKEEVAKLKREAGVTKGEVTPEQTATIRAGLAKTYAATVDQGARQMLNDIAAREFGGPLDAKGADTPKPAAQTATGPDPGKAITQAEYANLLAQGFTPDKILAEGYHVAQ